MPILVSRLVPLHKGNHLITQSKCYRARTKEGKHTNKQTNKQTHTHTHTAVVSRILGICSQEGSCGISSGLFLSILFSFPIKLEAIELKILRRFSFSIFCFKEIDNWYNAVFLTATNLWLNDCWRC